MTFNELAIAVLKIANKPLSSGEIWEIAVSKGLDKELGSKGKTPEIRCPQYWGIQEVSYLLELNALKLRHESTI